MLTSERKAVHLGRTRNDTESVTVTLLENESVQTAKVFIIFQCELEKVSKHGNPLFGTSEMTETDFLSHPAALLNYSVWLDLLT